MATTAATVFGIDLGTTYSALAYIDEFGQPVVVPNEDNEPVTASAIYFESPANVIVGKMAKNTGRIDPLNYVDLIKPHMGDPDYRRTVHGQDYRPEQLAALVLGKLKACAETHLGHPVRDVVITVPAYFDEQKRNATEQAGVLAGFTVKRIIPEPSAAAIAYAAADGGDKTVLVYDLGGGTFDVTVMRVSGPKVQVVCIKGDANLGGRQWDDRVVAHLAAEWQGQTGQADDPLANPETLQELLITAEERKKDLTQRTKVPVKVSHAGQNVRVELTREKFDELTAPLLETTVALTRDAAAEAARLGAPRIDLILLVGGSSRMPQVQARLKAEFPGVEQKLYDPDLAVAKGAAIYANSTRVQEAYADVLQKQYGRADVNVEALPAADRAAVEQAVLRALPGTSPRALASGRKVQVVNVCVKSFGLVVTDPATRAQEVAYLIKRNSPVPAEQCDNFTTLDPGQTDVELHIIESDAEEAPDRPLPTAVTDPRTRRLKTVTLNLPPGLPAGHPIEVKYRLSEDGGRLQVHARDPVSGRAIEDTVENLAAIQAPELERLKFEQAIMKIQ